MSGPVVGAEWARVIQQVALRHVAAIEEAPAAPAVPAIADLDEWLLEVMAGQEPRPKRYELHCHPDVYLAIRQASGDREFSEWPAATLPASPLYGGADVIVDPDPGSGAWELYLNGELVNSGNLRERIGGK